MSRPRFLADHDLRERIVTGVCRRKPVDFIRARDLGLQRRSDPEVLGVAAEQGLIVVSHDVQEVGSIADRSYLLAEGKVVASGSAAELRDATQPAVRQFMEGTPDGPVPFHYPASDYAAELLQESDK